MSRTRLVSLLFVTLAACGGSKKSGNTTTPPPTPDPVKTTVDAGTPATTSSDAMPADFTAEVDKAISLVASLATASEQANGDCAKMVVAMQAVANGADGGAVKAIDADQRYQQYKDQVEAKYGAKTTELAERLNKALGNCPADKDSGPKLDAVLVQAGLAGGGPGEGGDGDGDTDEGTAPHE